MPLFDVRWSPEKGWLWVLDGEAREWHLLPASACPQSWRQTANLRKAEARLPIVPRVDE